MKIHALIITLLLNIAPAFAACPPATVEETAGGTEYLVTIAGKTLSVPKTAPGNRHARQAADCIASGAWTVTPYTPTVAELRAQIAAEADRRIDAAFPGRSVEAMQIRALRLLRKSTLTQAEQTELDTYESYDDWRLNVRNIESAAEACVAGLTDQQRRDFTPQGLEGCALTWPAGP